MKYIKFQDKNGSFSIENPENYSGLYIPLAGENGLKSAITPSLGGDSKLDQNHFLLEPVSIENLHNNRNTRNFWAVGLSVEIPQNRNFRNILINRIKAAWKPDLCGRSCTELLRNTDFSQRFCLL